MKNTQTHTRQHAHINPTGDGEAAERGTRPMAAVRAVNGDDRIALEDMVDDLRTS